MGVTQVTQKNDDARFDKKDLILTLKWRLRKVHFVASRGHWITEIS